MANNTQRDELHKTIWAIADSLRGAVGGWEFKAYVLGAIFYRYISENITRHINQLQAEAGITGYDYAQETDENAEEAREGMVAEKGYFILPSQLFQNVARHPEKDENLNVTLNNIFNDIEGSAKGTASEDDMRGLFSDFAVNNSQLGNTVALRNKLLADVLIAVRDMKLGEDFENNEIDTFGDAYEYLMQMYASNAGKSGGEFFTPQEVSDVLARITEVGNPNIRKVYDPACGSGSLLLKFAKTVGKRNPQLKYFGQEVNPTTYNLCRINMFLHDINYDNFDIQLGDTLHNPLQLDAGPFDAIVSNPPYSLKWDGKDNAILINDPRYAPAGVLAPKSAADLAFTMHMLYNLGETGTCAIVEFPGVLYRGGDEQKIRRYLVSNNYVDTVIQLPQNLFFGVGIATCIIVLRKSARPDSKVLFIDASNLFKKDGNKNKLLPEHQDAIVEAYAKREAKQYFTALVPIEDIEKNDYNLSVSSYVEQEDKREKVDIDAINAELVDVVAQINELRGRMDEIVTNLGSKNMIQRLIHEMCPDGVPMVALGKIGSLVRGNGLQKKDFVDHGIGCIHYGQIYTRFGLFTDKTLAYVSESLANKLTPVESGNLVIACTSENVEDVCKCVAWLGDQTIVTGGHAVVFKHSQNPKYIAYCFTSEDFQMQKRKYAFGAKVIDIKIDKLASIQIPLPPLPIQERIVEILDKFTVLVSSLDSEISLRQKQYEYYREELLTFA